MAVLILGDAERYGLPAVLSIAESGAELAESDRGNGSLIPVNPDADPGETWYIGRASIVAVLPDSWKPTKGG
jgi:hypothetical protein